jgi:threonine/homoserine/homoserine lactone efflux protein
MVRKVMTVDLFAALFLFAGVAAFTPGPNNTLLLASGVNYGFKRTLPLIMGVLIGFPLMIGCIGLGLGQIFQSYPAIYTAMKYVGVAYMIWLAWKIATAELAGSGDEVAGKPMTFVQAALFQWINPKGWVMAVTAVSAYTLATDYHTGLIVVVLTFALMGITSASTWAMFGVGLRHVLNDPRYFRVINVSLALLLVASLVPMLWH